MGINQSRNPIDYMALSVDTSELGVARELMDRFAVAGGTTVKLGLETASAFGGPEALSKLASDYDMSWVYDGKIHDIGTTMANTIKNVAALDNPPFAITMHADTSYKGMKEAQEAAGGIKMLGVTLLTDIGPAEAYEDYANEAERKRVEFGKELPGVVGVDVRIREVLKRGRKYGRAGVAGLVAAPPELLALGEEELTAAAYKMIPGTRSERANSDDQMNTMTPEDAIAHRADLLVIGRQWTKADDQVKEMRLLKDEVGRGLDRRAA